MLIYQNTFENTKTLNCNFPIEDQFYATDKEAIVADGITRDPVGISDLNSISFTEMLNLYPRPSGGELAAKTITEAFKKSKGTIKERLIACNNAVKELNNKHIKQCDYLQNDYYGAVAASIQIKDNILEYAYICDCGIIVYDNNGNIKFQTKDDKELYSDPYINKINIPWNLPEARVIVRRDFRNNPNNIQNGICVSYEAITGEKNAEQFIRTGQITLKQNNIIAIYSDGFVNFLKDTTFINEILHFNKEKLEDYVNKKSLEDYNLYGKEKTLVLIKHI